jgi:hypothetical protein
VAEGNVAALLVPSVQVKAMLVGGWGVKGRFQEQMMESLARRLVRLLERLPMYQGVFSEPRTAAGLRRAMEKMYANWAI